MSKNPLNFMIRWCRSEGRIIKIKEDKGMVKSSLAHTRWNCKYHIVFAPKNRRQVIYGKLKREIGKIIRELCERKGVEILERRHV
ncbi:IS200 family transposase [Paenibacillus vortex V453]|uniref:IS200 family transposase n=1 Tax=Paenibacillus vortex V453 TaxID=715225 RepID=A0A2R9SW72_9BACL|nr:IS200 family transposase [Paenibacillus vortex V453]